MNKRKSNIVSKHLLLESQAIKTSTVLIIAIRISF